MRNILLLVAIVGVALSADYIHMPNPCPVSEICPGHPEAICKVDCMSVLPNGEGSDCIYHFYNAKGNLIDCFM